jgi:hypothetical protein
MLGAPKKSPATRGFSAKWKSVQNDSEYWPPKTQTPELL